MLEVERMKELNVKALIIQKVLKGYKHRYGTKKAVAKIVFAHVTLQLHVCMIHYTLKETIPEAKGGRSCHPEILERTQRQKAVQNSESLFIKSVQLHQFLPDTGLTCNNHL